MLEFKPCPKTESFEVVLDETRVGYIVNWADMPEPLDGDSNQDYGEYWIRDMNGCVLMTVSCLYHAKEAAAVLLRP